MAEKRRCRFNNIQRYALGSVKEKQLCYKFVFFIRVFVFGGLVSAHLRSGNNTNISKQHDIEVLCSCIYMHQQNTATQRCFVVTFVY